MSRVLVLVGCLAAVCASGVRAQPWMDTAKSPDERAALLERQLTQGEKLSLLHGAFAVNVPAAGWHKPPGAVGAAGYVPGVPRLGIPALQESDASLGITNPFNVRPGDTAVALPSSEALAAGFDADMAYRIGVVLGRQAAARGLNVVLNGGVNLARDPRGGRNFEYLGEDPLLAGVLGGAVARGIQDQHVISTVKHFAANDQETGRHVLSVNADWDVLRESDLLAFELAIAEGHPGAVMCAYNKVNSIYACENPTLLNGILKTGWHYPGWVMSDWGAVHGAAALTAGLDQESGEQLDSQVFFGAPLRAALAGGEVQQARVDDAVTRILRSMIAAGLLDHTRAPADDVRADLAQAQAAAAAGIVLLRNDKAALPLPRDLKTIAVIGGNADAGVLAGGGSSEVTPIGGYARQIPLGRNGEDTLFRTESFDPPAPLEALRRAAPGARVLYTDGRNASQAVLYASLSQAAIVFATQWSAEASDIPDLALPDGQDALIAQVAAANKRTIVVLETGGAVLMPWRNDVAAVLEAWYPGQEGAAAIADTLFGANNPAGRLPVTFPAAIADLPNPWLPGLFGQPGAAFPVTYPEGADAGYRWYALQGKTPLYPFGYGLSYTNFARSNLHTAPGALAAVSLDVTNTGKRAGADTPQLYLTAINNKPMRRLLAWSKVVLQPGETKRVMLTPEPRLLAQFDALRNAWHIAAGTYGLAVGDDAAHLPLQTNVKLPERVFAAGAAAAAK